MCWLTYSASNGKESSRVRIKAFKRLRVASGIPAAFATELGSDHYLLVLVHFESMLGRASIARPAKTCRMFKTYTCT